MRYEKEFNDCTNSSVFKKIYRRKECAKTGKCDRCPWHGGMDNSFGRKPKDDRYKDRRKERKLKYGNVANVDFAQDS